MESGGIVVTSNKEPFCLDEAVESQIQDASSE
jgi:hypothetical protein